MVSTDVCCLKSLSLLQENFVDGPVQTSLAQKECPSVPWSNHFITDFSTTQWLQFMCVALCPRQTYSDIISGAVALPPPFLSPSGKHVLRKVSNGDGNCSADLDPLLVVFSKKAINSRNFKTLIISGKKLLYSSQLTSW